MRVVGTIRSTATEHVAGEADTYEQAREQLHAQVPEGHKLIALRVGRESAAE